MKGRCLELGRVGSRVPLCWIGSDYPHILEIVSVCEGIEVLFQFAHPLRMATPALWVILLFSEDLGDSKLECSSLSLFAEDKLFPFFHLPLDFLEGVYLSNFFVLKQLLKGADRFLLSRIISNCSLWTQACSSNRLATSSVVPAM